MTDHETQPIPCDELRDLIDASKLEVEEVNVRRTVAIEPLHLHQILIHERTTKDLVIKLVKRKRTGETPRLVAICVLAGVWLGIARLVIA